MDEIKISGKDLGALNMPDFCPRCFWIKRKVKKLPYQIFPGIFMSIDAYTKRVMHAYLDIYGDTPPWLPELAGAGINSYLKVPHWSKFKRTDPVTGITVSGVMDDLFLCDDEEYIIPDYKTAKFTANQDKLLPIYVGQLNSYRWIFEGMGNVVKCTPLIYCEPVTDEDKCTQGIFTIDGFNMGFTVKTLMVDRDDELVPRLLKTAKDIIDLVEPPDGTDGCSDCEKLNTLLEVASEK